MKIGVLGDGAFGTAFANMLSKNGHSVLIWCQNSEVAAEINLQKTNSRFIPGFKIDKNVCAVNSLKELFSECEWVFEAIPVKYLESVLDQSVPFVKDYHRFVVLSKGIDTKSKLLPSQIIKEKLKNNNISVLSGPSFAQCLFNGDQTCVNIASLNYKDNFELQKLVENHFFKCEILDDVIGIQLCGALKNVVAIEVGKSLGKKEGENSQALIIVEGLKWMSQEVEKFGGKSSTVYSYCGVGDLILTCTGLKSKNLRFGKLLGEGKSIQEAVELLNGEPEGFNTKQLFNFNFFN